MISTHSVYDGFRIHEPAATSSAETTPAAWLLLWAARQLKQQSRRRPLVRRQRGSAQSGERRGSA